MPTRACRCPGGRPRPSSSACPMPVGRAHLAPGDLAFLYTRRRAPYHVALYVGDGLVVVAPHTGADVQIEPLTAVAWDGYGRLLKGGRGDGLARSVAAAARRFAHPGRSRLAAGPRRRRPCRAPGAAARERSSPVACSRPGRRWRRRRGPRSPRGWCRSRASADPSADGSAGVLGGARCCCCWPPRSWCARPPCRCAAATATAEPTAPHRLIARRRRSPGPGRVDSGRRANRS